MLDVAKSAIPFDTKQLDRLMDEAGIDVLIANSKHNIQYLLGGHRSIFFDYMDAMGISRYLPLLVYRQGRAGEGGLLRPPAGEPPEGGEPVLDARGQHQLRGLGRCHAEGDRLRAQVRRQGQADRRRDGVPAGRRGGIAAQRASPTAR